MHCTNKCLRMEKGVSSLACSWELLKNLKSFICHKVKILGRIIVSKSVDQGLVISYAVHCLMMYEYWFESRHIKLIVESLVVSRSGDFFLHGKSLNMLELSNLRNWLLSSSWIVSTGRHEGKARILHPEIWVWKIKHQDDLFSPAHEICHWV